MFYFFRINDPYRLAGLFIILVLIYLPVFIDTPSLTYPELKSFVIGEKINEGNNLYSELVDSVEPFTAWFYGLTDFLFGRNITGRHVLAFFIIYFQSAYLTLTFINRKVFTESTYLPAFIFSILLFFSFDTIALTGELLGSGLLLLALNNLMKVIEFRSQRDETFFNLGFFVSLSTLFEFSFIVFLVAGYAVLLMYTRNTIRSYLLILFGFLLPHFLLISIYFLQDQTDALFRFYYLANFSWPFSQLITRNELLILGSFPLAYFIISIVMLNRESRFTKYQSQLVQMMFLWMVFACFQILYSRHLRPQSFITLAPCLTFFITHFLLLIRRKKFAEMNLWILFLGVITINFLARYGYLDGVKYEKLIVAPSPAVEIKDKKLLVLENDLTYYVHNKLATPFFNWRLSKEIFEDPDYYQNVLMVYEAFKKDPPEIIIDKNGYLKMYMDRIPELKTKYSFSESGVYTRISN